MSDASYTDPRLAAVYDPLNPSAQDTAFYLDLAGTKPKTILDMGCGTGLLAAALAGRGHSVTGADPAHAMLAIARQRPNGEKVRWVETDAASLDLDTRFDLIVMTGHVFQVFLEDDAIRAALANLRRHLAPQGRLAFETRNPAVREWEDWTPDKTRSRVEVNGLGAVDVHHDIATVSGPLVTFETNFRFAAGDLVVTPVTLRFMDRKELAGFLEGAGFAKLEWHGDWDCSPSGPTSPEIIVVAG
jgi:SAM-dependent methyltransferase